MSKSQIEVTHTHEEEDVDTFVETLKKIMAAPHDSRGPAARAIMNGFQVYYHMIAAKAATVDTQTR